MIEIRKSEIKDYKEYALLYKQEYYLHTKIRPDIFKSENFKNLEFSDFEQKLINPKKILFTALYNGEFAGYIEAEYYTRFQEIIWISSIFVKENLRNENIGTLLIQKIEEIAKEKHIRIELNCWEGNPAIEFYKKLNFKTQRYILEKEVK